MTGRREMADDVAQDAFERASRAWRPSTPRARSRLGSTASSSTGRSTCCGRSGAWCWSEIRPRRRHAWADDAEDPEALEALAGLPAERRAVVVLRHLLDYTPPEIAEILDIPVGTVNSRLAGRWPSCASCWGRADDRPRGSPAPGARGPARAPRGAPPTRRARRPRRPPGAAGPPARRWLLAAAAAVAAVVVAGAALAATDRLDVRLGAPPAPTGRGGWDAARGVVQLPDGTQGMALVAGGRLWLGTREGLGVQGLAVSTAELSPNALYAAVGIGRSLVAIAPDGRRAWSHPTPGPVVAAAWAPNPS